MCRIMRVAPFQIKERNAAFVSGAIVQRAFKTQKAARGTAFVMTIWVTWSDLERAMRFELTT